MSHASPARFFVYHDAQITLQYGRMIAEMVLCALSFVCRLSLCLSRWTMSREGTCFTVNKQRVWKITAKDSSMELFLLPLALAMILVWALWLHDVRYQRQEAHAGNETTPIL